MQVHVVINMHRGLLYNTAVYMDKKKAEDTQKEWIKNAYGKDINPDDQDGGEDVIDLQTCEVIV